MRSVKKSKSVKHTKHSKLAYAGFILALAISFLALYYIWTNTAGFGKSIQGLQNYACVQYLKENPGQKVCPSFTAIETAKDFCCCYNPESTSKTSNFGEIQLEVEVHSEWLDAIEEFKATKEKSQDYLNFEEYCTEECTKEIRSLRNVGRCR